MSYATDLLDGFDTIYKRTEGVLNCNKEMANFYKKLSILEADYSKALLKLVKSTGQKKLISNQFLDGSLKEAWKSSLTELETVGNQHQTYSNLNNDLSNVVEKMVKDKEVQRKKLTEKGQKLTKDMKTQLDTLTKAKLNYHKLSKDAEMAQTALTKGQADPKMKQDKVSQLSIKSTQAAEKANQADQEYRDCLTVTNTKQHEYYMNEMPTLLTEFQQFEAERIHQTKESMVNLGSFVKEIPGVVAHAADEIHASASRIDSDADIRQWVSENKTNVTPPPPIDYYPFEGEAQPVGNSPSNFRLGTYKAPTGTGAKQEYGLSPKDSALPFEQKVQKLEAQLTDINTNIKTEVQARAGIEKLIQFYHNDPKEQKKAEGELVEADRKINALKESQKIVSQQLDEIQRNPSGGLSSSGGISQSTGSVDNGTGGASNVTPTLQAAKPMRAKGLYDYEASCDTELNFKEGDILNITEQDASGWWFAELNGVSGFVPQNYLQPIEE
ncbi:hypothetical protein DFA_03940 [Cavenderia fasciculata]|uniref:SH3 domain-containing protein n=1 Tax=Cavenderia fasciculata TaxID=261658 RepID=F4Q0U5_CACFS|nr:uncharacterized protein DFA_03940 [Cavenderia fasciculata]EGG18446.1 hypothetical protein DFA_03940 [Cavenderia fasciculata]|eukprot:XP_004366350.1 hypothetical protein DFA_03940 [Cavenderia fasciculata]